MNGQTGPIARLNDGSTNAPRLRLDLNIATLWNLPPHSEGPRINDLVGTADDMTTVRQSGYEGVQTYDPTPVLAAGLKATGMGRVLKPGAVARLAAQHKAAGLEATTLHLGMGFESDDEIDALVDAVIETSSSLSYPLFVETHRATATQDIRRTLDLVQRRPQVRFNADLPHWYTGHELTYGDFEMKLRLLQPVLRRVRYIHGRVGDSGCIQLSPEGREDQPFMTHFAQLWTACFAGFLDDAAPGDFIIFAPELLPATAVFGDTRARLNYAQECRGTDGIWREQGDRWLDARTLCRIATRCFADADAARA